jgi:nicotinamidase-related amidase
MSDLFLFVDYQKVFEDGAWKVNGIRDCLGRAKKAHDEVKKVRNVTSIVTRYFPPPQIELRHEDDAWRKYFEKYDTVPREPGDKAYELIDFIECDSVWESSTFSKWKHSSNFNSPFNVFITGVSTECCVLATALCAVDAGATVYVIKDACAAGSHEDHIQGLEMLSRFAPNVQTICIWQIPKLFSK